MKLQRILMEAPGRQKCPNCKIQIEDWHTEWILGDTSKKLVFRGEAGIDCPLCGASILIPRYDKVTTTAPSDKPTIRRSMSQVKDWATKAQVTAIDLTDYFQTPAGSQYRNYNFEP